MISTGSQLKLLLLTKSCEFASRLVDHVVLSLNRSETLTQPLSSGKSGVQHCPVSSSSLSIAGRVLIIILDLCSVVRSCTHLNIETILSKILDTNENMITL